MGHSAKVHKRVKKTAALSVVQPKPAAPSGLSVQSAKKRAGLKSKAKARHNARSEDRVLGGADYITLLLGGRRRAAEEARKLPADGAGCV